MRSAADDAAAAAREAALEVARQTPLRDHPAVKRGPGALGIALRIALASIVASIVGLLIVNRERVRTALIEARTRAARASAMGDGGYAPTSGAWSTADTGTVTVDEVIAVETIGTPAADTAGTGLETNAQSVSADQPTEDLDAAGWGTEGQPTAPRQISSDVAAMTNPSPPLGQPDELGE
jgi:hypothetical protein